MSGKRTGQKAAVVVVLTVVVLAIAAIVAMGCGSESATSSTSPSASATGEPIKVGAVVPMSGVESLVGIPEAAAIQLWAKEVNEQGGILGRPVELLLEDDMSDPKTTAEKTKLVISQGADVLIGPVLGTEWGAMIPIAKEESKIMLQPIYGMGGYGGAEWVDPLMFNFGAVPEQMVEPFVPWLMENYGDKFYFLGSDYIWSHTVNELAKKQLEAAGGKALGDEYFAIGTTDFSSALVRIAKAKPDLTYGLCVGADAVALMKQYYDAGLLSMAQIYEPLEQGFVPAIGVQQCEGVPTIMSYFSSLDTPSNKAFVEAYKEFNSKTAPDSMSTAAYVALKAWAKGVELAGTTETAAVQEKMRGLSLEDTPQGPITIRATDQYCALNMYIAVCKNGVFSVVKDLGLIDPGVDQRQNVPQ